MVIRVRRGLESNREAFTPQNGEPIFTTDEKKLYIGDGTTPGGIEVDMTGGGAIDHGALTGLADDDHTQYHTNARGDARYTPIAHASSTANPHSVTKTQVGLSNVDNTSDASKPVSTAQATAIGVVQSDVDAHEANTSNPHGVTKAQVGLSNVDNTSDANKPVSTATQTALNLKANSLGSDDNYVTDAEKVVIGNTSGTNTGDQNLSGYSLTSHNHTGVYAPVLGSDDNYVTDAEKVVVGNTSGTNTGDNATNTQYSGLAASKQDTITGLTASGAELNILDGATLTTAELNHVDGVTSPVQTQIDSKAATAHVHAAADVTSGVLANARIATGTPNGSKFLRDDQVWTAIPGGGDALVASPLSQFAATTSLQLKNTISDETGSGAVVFGTSPNITTPTGIVKGDVGLGNVDDTSDATKNAAAVTLTNKTLTTPILNGVPTGTGVATAATASTLSLRDASGNLATVNLLEGYTTTATAAGTTTLTVASNGVQFFTGATTQTVVLPVTSTLSLGFDYLIVNNSTGAVTVQSSGANAIVILAPGTSAVFTCILTSGTTAASWSYAYYGISIATGKKLTASNSLTLAGTDSTTMTFPSANDTVAGLAAVQTITGAWTFGAPGNVGQLKVAGNTSGTTTVAATAAAGTTTATLQAVTGTLYVSGGTDVTVADGGTGRSTATTAYGLIAAGTTATGVQQTVSPGTSGQFLKSAGASALPAFATLSGTDLSDTSVSASKLNLGASAAYVATNESTTSGTYVDLTTTTDTVTVTVGVSGVVLLSLYCSMYNTLNTGHSFMSFVASGANTIAVSDAYAIRAVNPGSFQYSLGATHILTGLTAGSTTFKAKYKAQTGGTANFEFRRIAAVPLG